MANSSSAISRARANEILAEASASLVKHPDLRLGQAIVNACQEFSPNPWPELFYEECPVKASEMFYSAVENRGRRELTGSLACGFFNLPINRH